MPAPRPTRNRWLAKLIVLSVTTLIVLVIAEIGTRVLWGHQANLFPRYHTGAQYGDYQLRRLRPNTTFYHTSADGTWAFTTNAQGYRDTRNWKHERTTGVKRVLVLGDSHTQGFECRQDKTYSAILEKRLNALGQPTEVLNCGISGMGTAEQLAFLENEGLKYQPDVVVLGWYVNDLDDNVKSNLFAVENGQLVERGKSHVPGVKILDAFNRWAVMRWLSEHSYFYSMVFNRVWEMSKGLLSKRNNAAADAAFLGSTPSSDTPAGSYQQVLALKLLERMRATCSKAGIKLVVADIPQNPSNGPFVSDDFESSLPKPVSEIVQQQADAFLGSEELFGKYRHLTDIFVLHGQHHISETMHLMLGLQLAEKISSWR